MSRQFIQNQPVKKSNDVVADVQLLIEKEVESTEIEDNLNLNYSWNRPFQCDITNCSASGIKMSAQTFSTHIHDHKRLIYSCTACNLLLGSPNIHHYYSSHPDILKVDAKTPQFQIIPPFPVVPWWCPICHSKFDSDALRYARILKDHHPDWANILRVTCDQCGGGLGSRFLNICELQLHARLVHVDKCGAVVEDEVIKKAVPPGYMCEESGCGKKFVKKISLAIHWKTIHLKECPSAKCLPLVCGKIYETKYFLDKHIKGAHGGEDKKEEEFKFRFKICGILVPKFFGKKHMLTVHNLGKGKKKKFN